MLYSQIQQRDLAEDFYLKDSNLGLIISITNKDFDNDDNPYMTIRAKIKSNELDEPIQLKMIPCQNTDWVPKVLIQKWYVG